MPIVPIEEFQATEFDYIVIGGGTAGLTVAARLSEDENVKVGVIEAGGYHSNVPEIDVPGFIGRTIANPTYDWTFLSVPQARAGGTPVLQPRGKGLGGSSLNNFLGMFRPSKEELDALEALGNPGWNWASLLEYMKKAVKPPFQVISLKQKQLSPIKKSFPTVWTSSHALLFDAAEALGIARNSEMGNGSNVGSMSSFSSIDPRTSKRSYAASEYYEPNAGRSNLRVLINAHVCKIILEQTETGLQRASGVELLTGGEKYLVKGIKKDIILSAGTFQTPQLLELSGIGNPTIMQSHGIAPVIELPGVGENLQDHICVRSIYEIDDNVETMDVLSDATELDKHLQLYKEQKGLLSSCPAPAFIFLSGQHLGNDKDLASWEQKASEQVALHVDASKYPTVRKGLQKQYNLQKSWFKNDGLAQAELLQYIGHQPIPSPQPVPGKRYTSLVSALMHPLSRGTVHIGSCDPLAPPVIDPNYFANEADLDLLLHTLLFTVKLVKTHPFADIVRSCVLPGPEILTSYEGGNTDDLRQYVKQTVGPVFHPVGTAAMLPLEDGGVVDSTLKVYGTTNLRVVDASILPLELSCHIQSLAYAIGEKAADILKKE
ncbi:hypothetical protein CVT26_005097 [Gymnopilus dilepis]|uniref:pyranose dehydrogenase (acceptor) n=1 Tax=Gymnopilus dilepis TaxID=231916 RepID=A0A409Y066_9AGAR|nr:hypothetical protein CVT26_005097 [Gymnopilus dilepis]